MSHQLDDASPAPVHAATTVAEAARAVLGTRLAMVRKRLGPVRAGDQTADDEVHGLRVATRRATSALGVFGPALDGGDRRRVRRDLRRIRRAAAVARAADVHAEMLARMLTTASGPRMAAIGYALGRLAVERDLGRMRLHDAARAVRMKKLHRRHERLVESVGGGRAETFGELAQVAVADCFDRLELAVGGELTARERLHELRLAVKRFRYVLEVVEPCLDAAALDEAMTRARSLQQRLGELNDLFELEMRLEGYAREVEDSERASELSTMVSGLRVVQGELDQAMREKRESFGAWWEGVGGPASLASLRVALLTVTEPHRLNGAAAKDSEARAAEAAREPTHGEAGRT